MGGPSVFPELPDGHASSARRVEGDEDAGRAQSAQHVHLRAPQHALPDVQAFDMPDTHESCGRRNITITAPQALSLLNGKVALDWAQAFAGRVIRDAGADDDAQQIEQAYLLAYAPRPDRSETRNGA